MEKPLKQAAHFHVRKVAQDKKDEICLQRKRALHFFNSGDFLPLNTRRKRAKKTLAVGLHLRAVTGDRYGYERGEQKAPPSFGAQDTCLICSHAC